LADSSDEKQSLDDIHRRQAIECWAMIIIRMTTQPSEQTTDEFTPVLRAAA